MAAGRVSGSGVCRLAQALNVGMTGPLGFNLVIFEHISAHGIDGPSPLLQSIDVAYGGGKLFQRLSAGSANEACWEGFHGVNVSLKPSSGGIVGLRTAIGGQAYEPANEQPLHES